MTIDASIALGVRPPQFESPVNAMAKIMQLKGLQQDQEMNTMRADEYRRGVDRQNRLMGLMQGGSDPEALRRGGFLKEAADWEKNSADTGKTKAETDKTAFSMNKERFGVVRKTAASFANDPQITKDRVVSALQLYAVGGVIPETLATQFSQGLPDDPAQLRAALQNFAKQDLTSEQLFTLFAAKPEKVDNGQQIGFRDTNPNSPTYGQNTAGAPVQKMQDPNSVASGQVQMRGQNMSDSRARERLAFDQGVQTAEAGGPSQAAYTKQFGKAEPGFRWKADGSSEPIPGGSKDIKANEVGEKRDQKKAALLRQADSVLETIKDSKDLTGYSTAGIGGMANVLPMTEARKLAGNLTTIKANLGFDRLQQMRDMSPTGGALGQVAVQELASLQATVAALDQLQKPSDLKAALEKIEKHYTAWRNTLSEGGASGDFGGSGGWGIQKVD